MNWHAHQVPGAKHNEKQSLPALSQNDGERNGTNKASQLGTSEAKERGEIEMPESAMGKGFRAYVERTQRIRDLSSPLLREIGDAARYSEVLKENFMQIGQLAQLNRQMIRKEIIPFLTSQSLVSEEMIRKVKELVASLMNASQLKAIDLILVDALSQRLVKDAYDKGDEQYIIKMLDKTIEDSYLLMAQVNRIGVADYLSEFYRSRGVAALDVLMTYLEKEKFQMLSPEMRAIIMVNVRYGAALYESLKPLPAVYATRRLEILERALQVSDDPFYRNLLPDYNWGYHYFRMYEYYYQTDARNLSRDAWKRMAEIGARLLKLYDSDVSFFSQLRGRKEIEGRCLYVQFNAGDLSVEEFQDQIFRYFNERDENDYSSQGLAQNLELPMDYLRALDFSALTETQMINADKIYRSALLYMFHAPRQGILGALLDNFIQLTEEFHEIPGGVTFGVFALSALAAIHPPTYVHSRMVAELTKCLCEHLLRCSPERFIGFDGYLDADSVRTHHNEISDFAFKAALHHDIGKITMMDTIFIYGRDLLDAEFKMIQFHPRAGAEKMRQFASTREYVDIAEGHHRWHDGSQGYPEGFDNTQSPKRVIIDLVACADSMDAATDNIGRSYKAGKSLKDVIREVEAEAGTRYAGWLPELLSQPEVQEDLTRLLAEKRDQIYRETYQLLRHLGALSS